MWLLKSLQEGFNQLVFDLGCPARKRARFKQVLVGNASAPAGLLFALLAPQQVIKRAMAIGDAPMRHDTFGIILQRLLEALHSFFEIKSKTPIQTEY